MKAVKTVFRVLGFILLLALVCALLCVAALWVYLATGDFATEQQDATATTAKSYAGTVTLAGDGITVPLTEGDLLYLFEDAVGDTLTATVEGLSPVPVKLTNASIRVVPDELTVYLSGRVLGFIPAHVRATFAVTTAVNYVYLDFTRMDIGPSITITADDILERGIIPSFTLELDEDVASLTLLSRGAEMTLPATLLTDGTEEAIREACSLTVPLYVLGADMGDATDIADILLGETLTETADGACIGEILQSGEDPLTALATLMGMADADTEARYLAARDAMTLHFLLPDGLMGTDAVREALATAREESETPLETALRAARESYMALNLRVEADGFTDLAKGTRVTPSSYCASLKNGATGQFYLLGGNARHPVRTGDMPSLKEIPYAMGLYVSHYPDVHADLGMLITLPCGKQAMCHYLDDGTLVLYLTTEQTVKSLQARNAPMYLPADGLPTGGSRLKLAATETVSAVTIIIPDGMETVD